MTGISKTPADVVHDDGPSLADFLPETSSGYTAYAGITLADGKGRPLAEEAVVGALKTVKDPEIPVNIYDLGLIYKIEVISDNKVNIDMTLTSPNCPVAESLPKSVKKNILEIKDVSEVNLQLVWDPPWDKTKMSETAKLELNL